MKRSLVQKKLSRFNALILTVISCANLSAQENQQVANNSLSGKTGWAIKDPFKSEVFIENNGQFNNPDAQPLKNVRYGINNGELKVYFSPSGLSYHLTNVQINPKYKNEIEEIKEKTERSLEKGKKNDESLKKYYLDKSAYVNIEWLGANPNAAIVVSDKVHDDYSYSVNLENGGSKSVIANAYKKLTYQNIYPNIDVEYYFPENNDKLGVEYNIVVHPGGNLSNVKMKYSGMQSISLSENGDIIVAIPDGNITDHAPGFSYVGNQGNEIHAKYILQDQAVSFKVPDYDNTKKLVIDPFTTVWNISPGFTTTNNGYTIRIDYNHNVYVMGGNKPSYQVKKFNPAGVLQWTAATPSSNLGAYGDMVVLRDGKAIVGMGIGNGNTANILASSNGAITNVNCPGGVNEFGWRIYYNRVVNDGVLWAGGGSNNGSHLIKTDTSLSAASIYNVWNSNTGSRNTEDIAYLAQDPASSFVYITNASNSNNNGVSGSTSAPKFCKSAVGTPGTAIWQVNEPTLMMELGQGSFISAGAGFKAETGVNGMVVCGSSIYTYDGNNIRNYNSANGTITNSTTSGGTIDKYSGVDVDKCCRLYVGVNSVVKRYSSTLAFDISIPVTSDVYDLQLDPLDDKVLYVTGKGFVQKISMYCPTCISITHTNVSGCTYGTATATVNDPAATAPLTYSWNTTPVQTTQTATGLLAGTYIVTVTDGAACPLVWKDTVIITGTFVSCGPTVTATGGVICSGACMSITATGASTPGPFTYSWQPGGLTGSATSVCPTTTTTYTVTAKDGAGATASTTAVVTVNPTPTVTVPPATICNGTSTTLTASGATTYSWNPGTGLSATTGASVTANPASTTTYTVTGAFATGCTGTTTVVVTVNPNPVVTVPPATICNGFSATLTASGATTYTWSPTTGLSSGTGTSVTANPTTTTTYTVIGASLGCTGSTTVVVTVNPNPVITVPPATICNGTSTTLTASGATTYTWSPTTGLSSGTGTSVTANPTTTTTYTVTGSLATGCTGTTTVIVTVNPNPVVTVPPATICAGTSTTLTASGAATYTWNPTTGLSSGTGTSVTANPAATTTYTVTGSFATGCTGTTTVVVTVNPNPVVTVNGATICPGATAPLTASGATTYTWSPTTGLSSGTGTTVTANPAVTTTYTVVGTSLGCTGSATVVVTVLPPCGPSVSATGATVCNGVCGTVTSTASFGTPPYNYAWNTGATTTSLTPSPCPTVTTAYTITVTDNSVPVGTATATAVITVNPNPVVTVPGATICAGASATLTASGATTYTWSPTTGLSSGTGTSVTANPTVTSTYTVVGSNPTGCTGTTTVTVTVNPIPVVTVPNVSICPGGSTSLTASGATTYTWAPVSSLSSGTGTTVTANPAATTTYTVIGNSNGCTSSTTVTVSVGALVANAGPDAFVCFGGSTTLNASGGTLYTWTPATGLSNSAIANPIANPTVTTTYTVTASDGTCSDDDVVVVTVNSAISLNAAGIDATCNGVCNGQLIVIPNGGTSPYTYSWSTGCTAAACNGICAGNYNLTATDAMGCTATASATVNQPTVLTSSLTGSTNVSCFGVCDGTATVSANGGTTPYKYSWAPSGGASAAATNLCAGTFSCTVTDANGCSVKSTATITQPSAIIVSSSGASICPNTSTTLTASTTGGSGTVTLTWSPAASLSSGTGASVIASPATTTVYTIAGTDANGCIGTTSVTVVVNPAPVINVPAATICQGTSTTLTANGASSYSWSPATNLSATTGASVIANPATTTTYTVIGTNSFGCTNSTTVTVTVNLAPVITTVNGGACPGNAITLTASGANTYNWSPATGLSTITGSTVIATLVNSITYTITGTSVNGCTATAIATATVYPKPKAMFTTSPEPADLFNPTIYFTDQSSGAVTWNWSLGDSANTKSVLQNPVHTYPAVPAKYLIHLVVTNQFGCIDSITSPLYIHGIFTFYIPNTFTPNNDGINDGFMPKGTGIDETDYDLWIFDRWGNLIWHTNIWGDAWDGRANHGADIAQIDTYVWKVHVKEKDSGLNHNYIGHVNIVK